MNRLLDRQEYLKEKRKKSFLVRSNIAGCILESDKTIYATKMFCRDRFTLRNGDKTIDYGKILVDYDVRINR